MTKDEIRAEMRRVQSALTPDWIARTSEQVQRNALELEEFRAARVVACYLADTGEVRTNMVLEACWKAGARVCVPAYRAESREYRWAFMEKNTRLKPGPWQILEPENPGQADDARIDFAVVPGVAFDRQGNRLGHGRGFYDRLLAGLAGPATFKLGFAFSCQVVEAVPALPHDVVMDAVATEADVFRRTRPLTGRNGKKHGR